MAIVQRKPMSKSCLRILVVDDEPAMAELFQDLAADRLDCQLVSAGTIAEGRRIIATQGVDLLVADVKLPDGNGLSLLNDLKDKQPGASALVITGTPNIDIAIAAMHGGAIDFLPKPFTADQLADRMRKALITTRLRGCQLRRLTKLKDTVKRLNVARKTVGKKVDLLCNDLIAAYGELSRQMDGVRIQQSFQQFLEKANGLEQLLCHGMDWMLRQVGYCNIGIWLTTAEQELQLGAFMKYTIAAEKDLIDALQKNLLRVTMRRGLLRVGGAEAKALLTPVESKYLAGQDILAINCTYLGESLGVLALFRDSKTPFSDDDVAALRGICPLFALSLARAVRGTDEPEEEQEGESNSPSAEPPKSRRKKDPADWWKNGEDSPF